MFNFRWWPAAAGATLGIGIMLPASVNAIELTGAWATLADLCKLVFTKKGNKIAFAELSDLYGSGFIIDGDRIKGKAAQCTIRSRKQDGDNVELSAACATSIMTSSVLFSLKVIDENNLDRMIPEVAGMALKYTRCPP